MSNKIPTFAEAYEELQSLTSEFEAGSLDLEVAVPKFKKAADLAKFLKKRLSEIENQIEEISLDLDKEIKVTDVEEPEIAVLKTSDDIPF